MGKVLAFGLLGAGIAAMTLGLHGRRARRPDAGPAGRVALARSGSVLLASLGLGLLISVVSDSERQAVQLSLLVLLASVFFSGFVLAIDEFTPAGPRADLPAAGHPRHPADPGPPAARQHQRHLGVRRARRRSPRSRSWPCPGRYMRRSMIQPRRPEA